MFELPESHSHFEAFFDKYEVMGANVEAYVNQWAPVVGWLGGQEDLTRDNFKDLLLNYTINSIPEGILAVDKTDVNVLKGLEVWNTQYDEHVDTLGNCVFTLIKDPTLSFHLGIKYMVVIDHSKDDEIALVVKFD